jgi:hypothetical protein
MQNGTHVNGQQFLSLYFLFCSDWKVAAEKVPEKVAISRGAAVLRLRP